MVNSKVMASPELSSIMTQHVRISFRVAYCLLPIAYC
jgi:hypothetical protein